MDLYQPGFLNGLYLQSGEELADERNLFLIFRGLFFEIESGLCGEVRFGPRRRKDGANRVAEGRLHT
jgi:hypothetical protein